MGKWEVKERVESARGQIYALLQQEAVALLSGKRQVMPSSFSCMHGGLTQTHMRLFFLGRSQSIIMYTKIYIYF